MFNETKIFFVHSESFFVVQNTTITNEEKRVNDLTLHIKLQYVQTVLHL